MNKLNPCFDEPKIVNSAKISQGVSIKKNKFGLKVSKLLQKLVWQLTKETEPIIRQKKSRFSNNYWYVYDPRTGRSAHLASEEEVRIWLEERYYR